MKPPGPPLVGRLITGNLEPQLPNPLCLTTGVALHVIQEVGR